MREKIFNYAIGALACFGLIGAMGIAGNIETHYTRKAVVVSVSDNIVTVKDTTNNYWTFEGTDFEENMNVKLKMFTNYTECDIEDDEVLSVKILK